MAACQAFLGHYKHPTRVVWNSDMRHVYTLGEGNGVFRWAFYGDREQPVDVTKVYEELEDTKTTMK